MRDKRVRIMVEIALAIALAAVLNMLKIWRMPNAGTVSFAMLPIVVIALRRGMGIGVLTGALYGIVDFFIDPYPPVHWIQPLLDYPVAYASVGLAGAFAPAWRTVADSTAVARLTTLVAAVATGAAVRYGVHVISGAIYFGEYAPEGQPVWVYSALYNLYVPVSAVLVLVAASVVMPALHKAVPVES